MAASATTIDDTMLSIEVPVHKMEDDQLLLCLTTRVGKHAAALHLITDGNTQFVTAVPAGSTSLSQKTNRQWLTEHLPEIVAQTVAIMDKPAEPPTRAHRFVKPGKKRQR